MISMDATQSPAPLRDAAYYVARHPHLRDGFLLLCRTEIRAERCAHRAPFGLTARVALVPGSAHLRDADGDYLHTPTVARCGVAS